MPAHAFAQGLKDVVPPGVLALLKPDQLQVLLSGTELGRQHMEAWQTSTKYEDLSPDENHVRWLWEWLHDANTSDDERRKLFKFVTGASRPPVGSFEALEGGYFTIQNAGGNVDDLPRAHTCFNTLILPRFSSASMLQQQFRTAIEEARYAA